MSYAWVQIAPGRMVYRKVTDGPAPRRSDLPCPQVLRDTFDQPVQSMANGQWYTSKRGLSASHRASGNPYGQDFVELGNETPQWAEHKTDERALRDDLRSAMADVKAGNIPPVLALDD
jgi:hypothetical protein